MLKISINTVSSQHLSSLSGYYDGYSTGGMHCWNLDKQQSYSALQKNHVSHMVIV